LSAGLYIHIPFCLSKCRYCDFYSIAAPHPSFDNYLQALAIEIAERSAEYAGQAFISLYFGGGTPSLFGAHRLRALLDLAKKHLHFESAPEITIEINPASCDKEELFLFKKAGINRVSIGLQSLCDSDLKQLGRPHNAEQGSRMFSHCRDAGFDNISVDFIHSLPWRAWPEEKEDLQRILALEPEHVSAYALTIEEGTEFGRMREAGLLKDLEQDEAANRILEVNRLLASYGFMRYEISNFARTDRHSRHNLIYWQGNSYLGLGAAASSFLAGSAPTDIGVRQRNIADHKIYTAQVAGGWAIEMREEIDDDKALAETIMLGLRLTEGIALANLEHRFGTAIAEKAHDLTLHSPLKQFMDYRDKYIFIREECLPLADEIALKFYTELES
jgi:putative oxygen-independent coproporphyrinogen III oxidase